MLPTGFSLIAQLVPGIGGLDWGIVGAFLVIGTILAIAMRGRQDGVLDFFLGNRNLPWTLVCGSLIATEISAASFVGVPAAAFSGSLVYLQLAIGTIIARVLVGYLLIPAFYAQPLTSPYHFIGTKLGLGSERMTRGLFVVGTVLGQAVRVFIVAIAIRVVTGMHIEWIILLITVVAALWALIGGIRSVVWTDLLSLGAIIVAGVAAAIFVIMQTTGGMGEICRQANDANKLRFLDIDFDLALTYTIWAGIFGSTFNTLASHGVDHMNTQRLFGCRSAGDARKAVIGSILSQLFVVVLIVVGLGIFAYYLQHPTQRDTLTFDYGVENILALFVGTVMPTGLKGLIVVGLLAAAISSLDSALAALAHVTSRSLYQNLKNESGTTGQFQVTRARALTVIWAVILGMVALYFHHMVSLNAVVGTALRVSSFTYGALLGAMLLALLVKKRDGRGLIFSMPIAVLTAFGLGLRAEAWTHWFIIAGIAMIVIGWLYSMSQEVEELYQIRDDREYVRRAWYLLLAEFPRTIWILAGIALVVYVHFFRADGIGSNDGPVPIAWPWYLTVGTGVTVVLGYLLSRPRPEQLAD